MTVDFALLRMQNKIPAYLKRHGIRLAYPKFQCVNPGHDDHNPSASIFGNDEQWKCHGCGERGDVVDLEMLRTGCDKPEAIKRLGGESWQGPLHPPPPKGSKPTLVRDFGTPPEDAPKLSPPHINLRTKAGNSKRWAVDHLYEYRDRDGVLQAYVARINHDEETGGKRIFPVRWHLQNQAWMMAGFQKTEARPLFNEHKLIARPQAEVLVVEGEKPAMIAEALFPDMVAITWMGGDKNADKSDYSALKGRSVTLWPDNDAVGLQAMDTVARKAQAATLLHVPIHKDWQDGWDVADVAETEPGAALAALMRRKVYSFDISPKGKPGAWAKIADGGWLPDHIRPIPGPGGSIKVTSASNAYIALLHHPLFATLGWDTLQKQIVWNGTPVSTGRLHFLHLHLNEVCGLEVNQGFDKVVESVAIERPLNRLADQIRATAWDGLKRLKRLFTYFGVEHSAWAVAGFRRWFLGHVARILTPGTKQDLILVLEGPQGQGKSAALEILGNAFGFPGYARLASLGGGRMNDNDMMIIAGQTLIELGEMTAHRKADLDHFKDITTRNGDKYRAPYSKDTITVPRTASFAGTTNLTQDYLTDPTGARRFVPMLCEREIDHKGLTTDREQLYAEAAHWLAQGKQSYFTVAEEDLQAVEVEKRQKVGYFKARMTELVEILDRDFIDEPSVWGHLGVPLDRPSERKRAFDEVKMAMLELGYSYRRTTVEERRLWGFVRNPRGPGRRPWKVTLTPRS